MAEIIPRTYAKQGDRYKELVGHHEGQPIYQVMPEGFKPEPGDEVIETSAPLA